MKVFAILALATSVLAAATPMVERDTFDPNTALDKYRQTAVETTQELFLNGCHIVDCVEALAPLIKSCAIAAAERGRNKEKDAACVADAYQREGGAGKPAACDHCYH